MLHTNVPDLLVAVCGRETSISKHLARCFPANWELSYLPSFIVSGSNVLCFLFQDDQLANRLLEYPMEQSQYDNRSVFRKTLIEDPPSEEERVYV